MFFFGENQRSTIEDYRPEVHDSDGLSIESGTGEWLWRPLVNPRRLLVTSFALTNPAGFGLMQRDRGFEHYEDLEARYDLRPSAWVEPKGPWGSGRIELVEIPNPNETNDNIVAYWIADRPAVPAAPYDFEYRVLWQKEMTTRPPSSWVTQTRRGRGYVRVDDGSLGFMPYLIPDGALLQALQTSVLRGVEVTLVVPLQMDQILVCLGQRSYYDELLSSGVRICRYGRRFLHAKHITIDDQIAWIGSSNLDIRSFSLNAEIVVLLYDRAACRRWSSLSRTPEIAIAV